MRVTKLLALVLLLVACVVAIGCSGGSGSVKSGGDDAQQDAQDSLFVAEKAASVEILREVPDAVLVSASSGGIVFSPPPRSWDFMYGSPSMGRMFVVSVQRGAAEKPKDISPLDPQAVNLSSAVEMSSVKVGSVEAYEAGKALLEKRDGGAPPHVMMGINFVELPGLKGQSPGDWALVFAEGISTEGMQQVLVDGETGEATTTQ